MTETATAVRAATVRLREYAGQVRETGQLRGGNNKIYSVAFSPDGRLLATGTVNKVAYLWERSGTRLVHRLEGHGKFVWSVSFSPDGELLATSSGDMSIFFWEVASGRPVRRLWAGDSLYTACFSPDGRRLAAGSHNRCLYLWDLDTHRPPRLLAGHGDDVYSVAFSPDGELLASGSDDHTVRLWEASTGRPVAVWRGDFGRVYSVVFSPDGRLLAFASADRTIRLWETASQRQVGLLAGHEGPVWSVAFSPDGELLASGSGDQTVRLWETATGQQLRVLAGHGGDVNSVGFSPDGRLLVSGSDDRTVRFWDVAVMEMRPAAGGDVLPFPGTRPAAAWEETIAQHRETMALTHVEPARPRQAAVWLRQVAKFGLAPPLWLVHDLGALLAGDGDSPAIRPPADLPPAMAAGRWELLLHRLAADGCWEQVRRWRLADELIGVIIARLLAGLEFAAAFRLPAGNAARVFITARLAAAIAGSQRDDWRRQLAAQGGEALAACWSPEWAAAIEERAARLEIDELRLLRQYGAVPGEMNAARLQDLYGFLELPPAVRRTLAAVLRLLPRLRLDHRPAAGSQVYALGGYQGVTRRGNLDSLVPAELAHSRAMLLYRLLNREALYYGRETAPERRREMVYLLTQAGLELQGDGEFMARVLTLALAEAMRQRGYEVRQSFFGSRWTPPAAVGKPAELQRLVYYRDRGWLAGEAMLNAVLRQLASWEEEFPRRRVFWVVSEFWEGQLGLAAGRLLPLLAARGDQHAWLLRCGGGTRGFSPRTGKFFRVVEVLDREVFGFAAESD